MKKILSLALCLLMIISALPVLAQGQTVEIYVSADTGNASASGTIQNPVKTLGQALNIAKEALKENDVRILLRGGTYRFSNQVLMDNTLSGSTDNSLIIEAYNGEKVNFKASAELDATKAQPVTDESVRNRLYPKVRDKLVVIDLTKQGIDKNTLANNRSVNGMYALVGRAENNAIYLDDKEQSLSRYPNDRHYARWVSAANEQTFVYSENNPSRWTQAKDVWIAGFPTYDYSYSRMSMKAVDPKSKTITVIDNPVTKFTSYMTRRWAAYNLMEEIDIPGEYYIERDTGLLYYYPPYSLKDAKLEISLTDQPILFIEGAKNITFKGINFSQTRSDAVYMRDVDNIDFIECDFRDVSVCGIVCSATEQALTGQTHWEKQRKNGSYNVDIKACNFYNIGMSAIDITGGDIDTLRLSNNIIEDCFISRTGEKAFWESISLRGCGITVRNNNISGSTMQAIRPWGTKHLIEYNEFYDHLRESDDCGVIYWGGNTLFRGTMVQYNFFHDCYPIEEMVYNAKAAIYWDDGQCGQSAQYNIIQGFKGTGFNSNGAGDTLHRYNMVIDARKAYSLIDHVYRQTEIVTMDVFGTIADTYNDIYDKELYFKEFPNLEATVKHGINPKKFSQIYGNLEHNCEVESTIGKQEQEFSKVYNNFEVEDRSVFANPEKLDFRLKADSDVAKKNPNLLNTENFDIEEFGMKREMTFNSETSPFKMIYPKNGEASISVNKVELAWEKAFGANQYRLVVAKDRDFSDIVYDKVVDFSTMNIDNLEKNTNYYWTVYAQNESREFSSEWQSVSGIYSFSTSIKEEIETDTIKEVVDKVTAEAEDVTESELPGDYKPGTVKKLEGYTQLVNFFIKQQIPMVTQKKLDSYGDFLRTYLSNPELVNPGFMDLSTHFKKEEWNGALTVSPEAVVMRVDKDGNHFGGTNSFEAMTGNVVYCFDSAITLPAGDSPYLTMGLSLYNDRNQWTSVNLGYYIVVKNNVIELQKVDGTSNKIIATSDKNIADGKAHQFIIGRVTIENGNYVTVCIDGEQIFSFADVAGGELKSTAQFAMAAYNAGTEIKLLKYSGEIPDLEKFAELKHEGIIKGAEALYDAYKNDYVNYSIVNTESDMILLNNGMKKLSHKPVLDAGDNMFVTADTFSKMFDCEVNISGDKATVILGDKQVTVTAKQFDSVPMLSANEACGALGKNYTYDEQNKNYIVADSGALVVLNEVTRLTKTAELFKIIEKLGEISF